MVAPSCTLFVSKSSLKAGRKLRINNGSNEWNIWDLIGTWRWMAHLVTIRATFLTQGDDVFVSRYVLLSSAAQKWSLIGQPTGNGFSRMARFLRSCQPPDHSPCWSLVLYSTGHVASFLLHQLLIIFRLRSQTAVVLLLILLKQGWTSFGVFASLFTVEMVRALLRRLLKRYFLTPGVPLALQQFVLLDNPLYCVHRLLWRIDNTVLLLIHCCIRFKLIEGCNRRHRQSGA